VSETGIVKMDYDSRSGASGAQERRSLTVVLDVNHIRLEVVQLLRGPAIKIAVIAWGEKVGGNHLESGCSELTILVQARVPARYPYEPEARTPILSRAASLCPRAATTTTS